jgi:hypothetical protein
MKNCYEFVLTYGPVPFIIHVSSMIGWSFMKKKAVDPDRIHPVLSMFLDRREELFFFSSSFFFFFFWDLIHTQHQHNNHSHEGGPQCVGSTLM